MRIVFSALLVVSIVGCAKKKEAADNSAAKTTETKPAAVDTSKPKLNGEPVDACALLTKDQIKAVIDEEPKDPKIYIEPEGSELGDCSWTSSQFMVQVHARPASEFDGSVRDIKDGKEIAGVGEKAVMTGAQMLVKVPGKPYFLVVSVGGPTSAPAELKEQRITEMAKTAVANAK